MISENFKFENFFELSPDLLCIAGFDGYFRKVNQSVSNTLGYSFEELYSRPIHTFVHPEDRDITAQTRSEMLKADPLMNFENRYITKSGEIVWLAWTSMAVRSEELVFAIAKNVTHKKKHDSDRNTLLANLTEVNKDLKKLSYTTSHDLRSPVNNLISIVSLLDSSKVQDPETLELLDLLQKSSAKLKERLDLYVDQLEENKALKIALEPIALSDILESVTSSISNLITSSGALIESDFSEYPTINSNRSYLESIFLNLLSNSIKYSIPGKKPKIYLRSRRSDKTIFLEFSDNGLGFDLEKVKDKLFGFHQTFHENKDSKGIGLYLVFNHVQSLQGKIAVDSAPNQGTTFTISLPPWS